MCTVTFHNNSKELVFTSTRDESRERPPALAPRKVTYEHGFLYYPVDPQSEGTWFGVKSDGTVVVLLNGAEKKHIINPPYRKSRGLVLLDILRSLHIPEKWQSVSLLDIEPFTLVLYFRSKLYQLRWDGKEKQRLVLDETQSHIWSSSTLYVDEIALKRGSWFTDFLDRKKHVLSAEDLIAFHTQTHTEDKENGLLINRNDRLLSKSVTQCTLTKKDFRFIHIDLLTLEKTVLSDNLT